MPSFGQIKVRAKAIQKIFDINVNFVKSVFEVYIGQNLHFSYLSVKFVNIQGLVIFLSWLLSNSRKNNFKARKVEFAYFQI